MKHSFFTLQVSSLSQLLLLAISIVLVGCAAPPQARLLSRLSTSAPEAAAISAATLNHEERKEYAAINQQVLAEQNQAIAEQAAAEAAARAYRASDYYMYSPLPFYRLDYRPRWRSGVYFGPRIRQRVYYEPW